MIIKLARHVFLTLLVGFFLSNSAFAQTTLLPGDIAILEIKSDNPDNFAFITFVNIAPETGIYFTDCGSDSNGFLSPNCTEGAKKYTVPVSGLNAGDIIKYDNGLNTDFSSYTDSRITRSFSLSTSGDQIIAFQDSTAPSGETNAANHPAFIFIAHNASTVFTGDPSDSNRSSLPPGLSDTTMPRTAIGLGAGNGDETEWDNVIYNGSYNFSSFTTQEEAIRAAKLAMTNPVNFHKTNDDQASSYLNANTDMPDALVLPTTLSNKTFSKHSFIISPNPSYGSITVSNPNISLQKIIITDLNGRIVFSDEPNKTSTHLNLELTSGMYLIQLISNQNTTIKKIIIK